ncbi:nitronate monooxygenase [Novosphingobium sp. 9]|uniref:NAD(P)H-dependent flavin oxidoreductase n=1 Tax=Novosphingobium sp. 9 TaxID=2025349 RepID=UPI0028CBAFC0|nr:nitronate monooxygenase [Novosphingobium sp. 9]
MNFVEHLGLSVPLVQAPMAGVSTPAMAAAVCEAGALGSLGLGAMTADQAAATIADLKARTARPFNLNLFVHATPVPDPSGEAAWLDALTPLFASFDAESPKALETIYASFAQDDAMLCVLVDAAPAVVSFHFGLPDASRLAALRGAGCLLVASVTSLAEAQAAARAGIDVLVAQGWEAGGHRGMFDPEAPDAQLGTFALTRLLVQSQPLPVIAAGGIMDGAGIRAALDLGAAAAQLGTAFVACPESAASDAYRAALTGPGGHTTRMTRAISGRPARCLGNAFTAWGDTHVELTNPAYPRAYDAGKALAAAARAKGEFGFDAQWAGQAAPLARALPAGDLVALLAREIAAGSRS